MRRPLPASSRASVMPAAPAPSRQTSAAMTVPRASWRKSSITPRHLTQMQQRADARLGSGEQPAIEQCDLVRTPVARDALHQARHLESDTGAAQQARQVRAVALFGMPGQISGAKLAE